MLLRFSHSLFEELGRDRIPKLAPVELLLSALTSYLIEFEDQMLDNLVARLIVLELQIGRVAASLNFHHTFKFIAQKMYNQLQI